jgi:hypothetical protein
MPPAGTPPLLVTVKVWDELVWPICVLVKAAGPVGVMLRAAGAVQTPLAPSQIRPPAHASPAVQLKHWPVDVLHWVLWQVVAIGAVQSPSVLHTEAEVNVPPVQLAGTHWTPAPA